jgi:FtsZ-interacting cell division protein ZipA
LHITRRRRRRGSKERNRRTWQHKTLAAKRALGESGIKMADIRSSGDDALPAPQQSQSPKDELTNMPSEDFNPRSTSLDNKQPVTNDSASSENKSNEEEAVPAAQPAAQPAPPQAPPTPSPAEVAMQKQVKDVLISDVWLFYEQYLSCLYLIICRLALPHFSTV